MDEIVIADYDTDWPHRFASGLGVPNLDRARAAFPPLLESAGYASWADNPRRDRLVFVKGLPPSPTGRTHHVHVAEPTSEAWKRPLLFRDYLRTHPQEAQTYPALKRRLGIVHRHDREAYTQAEDAYISQIVRRARTNQEASGQHGGNQ